jgi:hypothetical protein
MALMAEIGWVCSTLLLMDRISSCVEDTDCCMEDIDTCILLIPPEE